MPVSDHSAPDTSLHFKILSLFALLTCLLGLTLFRLFVLKNQIGESACAWLTVVAVLLLVALSFLGKKQFAPSLSHGLPSVTFGASVAGFMALTVCGVAVYFALFPSESVRTEGTYLLISLLMKLFLLASAVYFLLTAAYMELPQRQAMHLLLSMMPALFFAFRILNDFIENSAMPLAGSGGYHLLGMMAAMLFFLCEGKMLLGNGNVFLFLLTGQIALLLNGMYEIPMLFQVFFGDGNQMDLVYALFMIAVLIYIGTRMASLQPGQITQEEPVAVAE